ncbi:MAG: hypothetical protein KAY06_09805 [Aeromonadaceae bacterium]|nr:hypothetical protein [Aeromonadaceae bacterium]
MSAIKYSLLFCLLSGLAGCHSSTRNDQLANSSTYGNIEALFPHQAESEVPVNSQIRLHLPAHQASTKLANNAFRLTLQATPEVLLPLQVSDDGEDTLLTPEQPLAPGSRYLLQYGSGNNAWKLDFTTEQRSDYPVKLPQPAGDYGVGELPAILFSRSITPNAEGQSDTRPIDMQIWYPVGKIFHGQRAPYLDQEIASLGEQSGLTTLSLNEVVRTNARLGEQGECARPHPLILFSPGYGELSQFYRTIIEPLVARGYVVAGINHASTSMVTRSGNGDMESTDPIPSDLPAEELQAWLQNKLDANVADLDSAIERIALESSADTLIKGCVDLQHIGLLGHSFGGATAMEALVTRNHYLAAVNLDGDLMGKHHTTASNLAVLQMQSTLGTHDNSLRERDATLTGEHHWLEVAKSDHLDFSDLHWYQEYLQGPLALPSSSMDPAQMVEIETLWLGTFFDHTLKGESVTLEDLSLDGVRILP